MQTQIWPWRKSLAPVLPVGSEIVKSQGYLFSWWQERRKDHDVSEVHAALLRQTAETSHAFLSVTDITHTLQRTDLCSY